MSAHWIHLVLGFDGFGFRIGHVGEECLEIIYLLSALYIKHAMFPSSNFVEEIPTSKQHIVQSGHPSSPLRLTVADSLSTGKTPPSTNILNSGDIRTGFLFGQPVAETQMETVVCLSLGLVCSRELAVREFRCSLCGDSQNSGIPSVLQEPSWWQRAKCFFPQVSLGQDVTQSVWLGA